MADSKITALTALTAADPVNDMFPIVDVSDTTMAASGTTKRISANNILSSSPTASGALTVTGLVTAGSATISGALTVDTTTLVVDAANDRVGIGTATPVARLIVRDGANRNLLVASDASHLGSTGIAIGSFTDNAADWAPLSLVAKTSIAFGLNGSTAMTLNATGNLAFPTGKGIDFSAVTGGTGTATANVLNDYEEGTFVPTIIGSTTAGTGTYTGQNGKYTKVGNLVTFQVFIDWSAHTGTGNMRIGNLPFTNSSNFWAGSIGYLNNIALTAGNIMTAYVEASQSYVTLQQYPTGGGPTLGVPIDTSGAIIFSGSYTV